MLRCSLGAHRQDTSLNGTGQMMTIILLSPSVKHNFQAERHAKAQFVHGCYNKNAAEEAWACPCNTAKAIQNEGTAWRNVNVFKVCICYICEE